MITDIDEELTKRQSEIFEKIKEKHQQFDREAEQEAKCVEQAWEEQGWLVLIAHQIDLEVLMNFLEHDMASNVLHYSYSRKEST